MTGSGPEEGGRRLPVFHKQHSGKDKRRADKPAGRKFLLRHVHQAEVIDREGAEQLPGHDGRDEGRRAQLGREGRAGECDQCAQRAADPVPPRRSR